MALSLSWAILGIDREQLKRRIFGQRIADVFVSVAIWVAYNPRNRINFLSDFATRLYT